MSDSERDLPSEATISQKLRDVVISIHKTGKEDDLTVKRIRARAEKELSLPEGFLKQDAVWKQKSQETIGDAVDKYCREATPEPTPKKAVVPKPTSKPVKKSAAKTETKGVKRKAAAPAKKPKKRRKTDSEDDLDDDLSDVNEPSEADSEAPKKKKLVQRGKKIVTEDSDEDASPQKPTKKAKKPVVEDESEDEPAATPKKSASTPPPATKGSDSDSELSVLLDESPKKKPRKKEPAKKTTKPALPKAKPAKPKADDDPDTAEVKRLQGWLVKCGIRKIWSKDPELSKCDTDKEKIRVLKGMLKDVGMDGKYSVEKAAKIKEKREFEKDLAAIQEAEAHWGTADNGGRRPRRAAAAAPKPQQKLEFSDDEEEESGDGADDQESSEDEEEDDEVKGESGDDDDDNADSGEDSE